MLNLSLNNRGLVFSVNVDGHDVHFKEWSNTDDCIYYFPLETLVDNGDAEINENGCLIPYENIYLLDDEEKELLGVPKAYDKAIRLRGEGLLNTPTFRYKLDFLTHVPDGDFIVHERKENIISTSSNKYLLNKAQYKLIHEVDNFNQKKESEKTPEFNMYSFALIKQLAIDSGCQLDGYLGNENVYIPDKIKLELEQNQDGYTINPSIDIPENKKFQEAFNKFKKVQNIYPIQRANDERIRVVLNKKQKDDLGLVRKQKQWPKGEIKKIIDKPTEYFDPDCFDLSELYSDRVIELGVYKPKFYPFICPYESCWIAGATVETSENGTSHIKIRNADDLNLLYESIKYAEENRKELVDYQNNIIGLNDAKFLAETAKKQLESPDKPISVEKEGEEKSERKVLIIEENAESVGFAVEEGVVKTRDKVDYILFNNPFLQEGFGLKEHQKEGVAWFQYLYNNKISGCLMADDMGLGKTLQVLYFIDWHSRKYPDHKPYLIVAPISLLENWENEYNKFFREPRMTVNRLTSKDVPRQFDKKVIENMQKMDIILTNYESLRVSQLNFCAVSFEIVVLDEAQKIKSPGTMVTNAAKALKASFKIAMTGTPVENTLLDLWCIMDFCVPGLLGSAKEFASKYQHPLKNKDTDIVALGNEIHEKLGLYFMRRLKKDAAKDLPEKIEFKERVNMPKIQEKTYNQVINNYLSGDQPNILLAIKDLREVSEHPYLYTDTLYDYETSGLIETSARLQATIGFLDKIKIENEKVIIFIERKDTQKMMQKVCFERYGIITKIINGDTPSIVKRVAKNKQSRQNAIDEFQEKDGFNIIIMSPIAAGMGLNITGANHVIHYSRNWNPAKENQATDRAYRIGQTKTVYVYYPMAISDKFKSFDVTLDELLNEKTSLATSVIFPTERIEVKPDDLKSCLIVNAQSIIPPEIIEEEDNPKLSKPKYIGYNPINKFTQTEPLNYPYVIMPSKSGCVIKIPQKGRTGRKGYKEYDFLQYIQKYFKETFKIYDDRYVLTKKNRYEPDILLLNEKDGINIFLDIEIDEPYVGTNDIKNRKPTHFRFADVNRNNEFKNRGWIIIRFAEIQVHQNPKECCRFIADVIKSIYPQFNIPLDLVKTKPIEPILQWTKELALNWSAQNYREQYLGIGQFGYIPIIRKTDFALIQDEETEKEVVDDKPIELS